MKLKLVFLALIFIFQVKAQSVDYIPIDSAGYYQLIDGQGVSKTTWTAFEDLKYYSDNNFIAKKNGKWGIVDTNLTFLLNPEFDTLEFVEQYIFAISKGNLHVFSDKYELVKKIPDYLRNESIRLYARDWENQTKYISKYIVHTFEGATIYDSVFNQLSENDLDDAFPMNNVILTRKGDLFGFLSYNDSTIEAKYTSISFFNDWIVETTDSEDRRHYFNEFGKKFPETDSILQYDERFDLYKIYQKGKGYLYTINLEPVVEYIGDDVFPICYNRYYLNDGQVMQLQKDFFAFRKDHKIGVLNNDGSVLIQPTFDHVIFTDSNRFIVMENQRFGVVDANANWIINPEYTYVSFTDANYFKVYDSLHVGVCNHSGKLIIPVEYQEIMCTDKGIITENNSLLGFADTNGRIVLKNEWLKFQYLSYSITEFTKGNSRCAVNKLGLLTPINCLKIYANEQTIKYYLSDKIVIAHVENDTITDTETYSRYPSVIVVNDDQILYDDITEGDIDFFQSQFTGKFGSIRKHGNGFEVDPIFDIISSEFAMNVGYRPDRSIFDIDCATFDTKDILQYFNPYGQASSNQYLAYLGSQNTVSWHSSSLDGIKTPENKFEYASHDQFRSTDYSFLLSRSGFTSRAITQGTINLSSGQDVIRMRDYFMQLNSYNNLVIKSIETFSLLSTSPMIKVENPIWEVKEALNVFPEVHLMGPYKYYQELPTGLTIFSEGGTKFGIYKIQDDVLAKEEFDAIVPFVENTKQYFYVMKKVRNQSGFYDKKWTLFDFNGQRIKDYYSSIESIAPGFHLVSKDGHRFVLTENGELVYRFEQ